MSANPKFNYVTGSSAKKYEYQDQDDDYPKVKKNKARKIVSKAVTNDKAKVRTVFLIACLFAMLMVITYRFNVISESNLTLQNLKTELNTVQSNLAATTMSVEQSTNLSEIEAYSKQKLGMQKPDKNQVVYIDTSKDTSIIKEAKLSFVDEIIVNIKEYINNIKL